MAKSLDFISITIPKKENFPDISFSIKTSLGVPCFITFPFSNKITLSANLNTSGLS
ncbi:hypothetical protein [Sulfurihydrogenibium sp. YO3AOP1]|uniref:hypothetical protein n=1 Tax=Sulfurihydrogenibium sp. (strain YO3AOP1) TaxID=436114 RepID=UPI0024824F6A|nr:hypothetical protein [Sulfurihydrogenibium sp. YO3AOP1]